MNYEEITGGLNLPEILGRPKRGIIFSDLDGVWFDESRNFAPPQPEFVKSIALARKSGFWVVLNSDTAPQTLADYANTLGANRWVIAENGGVIFVPKNGYWFSNPSVAEKTASFQEMAVKLLTQRNPESFVWKGDATPFIQSESPLPEASHGQIVYLINTARITSVGIYTRKASSKGILTIDATETQNTEVLLQNIIQQQNLQTSLVCKRYPEIGSCLVKDPRINKSDAVRYVIDQYGDTLSYWMVGDTVNDSIILKNGLIRIGAVGNAVMQLKNAAVQSGGIVAPSLIAEGADFIIRKILEKEGI